MTRARDSTPSSSVRVPPSVSALAEACTKCARQSIRLLTQSWIDGAFVIFDCFFTQYLFSSLTILAVSSLLDGDQRAADRESFDEAAALLRQLKDAGNYVAQEYCHHIEAMQAAIAEYECQLSGNVESVGISLLAGSGQMMPAVDESMRSGLAGPADMTWTEPSLQELLTQPALDMQSVEAAVGHGFPESPLWSGSGGHC